MQISSLFATQGYKAARPATEPATVEGAAKAAVAGFSATLENAESQALAAMQGNADPHALVQALAQTELAVETAVTVRDRVVEAYQEILRMPV
jgi:flagellar hook-basal body complex protein FliE